MIRLLASTSSILEVGLVLYKDDEGASQGPYPVSTLVSCVLLARNQSIAEAKHHVTSMPIPGESTDTLTC